MKSWLTSLSKSYPNTQQRCSYAISSRGSRKRPACYFEIGPKLVDFENYLKSCVDRNEKFGDSQTQSLISNSNLYLADKGELTEL